MFWPALLLAARFVEVGDGASPGKPALPSKLIAVQSYHTHRIAVHKKK